MASTTESFGFMYRYNAILICAWSGGVSAVGLGGLGWSEELAFLDLPLSGRAALGLASTGCGGAQLAAQVAMSKNAVERVRDSGTTL